MDEEPELRPLPPPPRCRGIPLGAGNYTGCAYPELPDLLRLPEVARLLDAGQVSIQPGSPPPTDESSTRRKGRELFERRATQHGLRVSTFSHPGVSDFIGCHELQTRPTHLLGESPDQPSKGLDGTSRPALRVRLAVAVSRANIPDELQGGGGRPGR